MTEKGELNRWLRSTNSLHSTILRKLADLIKWIREIKSKLDQPKSPHLAQFLHARHDYRNSRAWSRTGRIRNLQELAKIIKYLQFRWQPYIAKYP